MNFQDVIKNLLQTNDMIQEIKNKITNNVNIIEKMENS